jgi:hypothetical protein
LATAEKIAVRSAQLVIPYEEFSTLQPTKTSPFVVRMAAPTRKLENGAYAFLATLRAARSRRLRVATGTLFVGILKSIGLRIERL